MSSRVENTCGCYENRAHANRECLSGCGSKLNVHNWMYKMVQPSAINEVVEVRFKNTRKGFYKNVNQLNLRVGDIVAVEASPGHDIGVITLTGELVREQMKKYKVPAGAELKKVYRKAKQADVDKWEEAKDLEHETMIESRRIARDLKLNMKIGDVEYQGDRTKAIFYYIAEDRVDFRQLIKVLAERFRIRVEMKQIAARQEAGLIGGIGSCGRELCCSTWISDFVSVTTNAARVQQLSLNPQKLAGQCGKLKCCLNYELDSYIAAQKDFPQSDKEIKSKLGTAYHQKTDVFRRIMYYQAVAENSSKIIALTPERVKEILQANKKGVMVETWKEQTIDINTTGNKAELDYTNSVGTESLTRFDSNKKKNPKRRKKRRNPRRNEKR
ncbi:PSP1 domain-containing protein [Salinivirga cyanobacteriivorans]